MNLNTAKMIRRHVLSAAASSSSRVSPHSHYQTPKDLSLQVHYYRLAHLGYLQESDASSTRVPLLASTNVRRRSASSASEANSRAGKRPQRGGGHSEPGGTPGGGVFRTTRTGAISSSRVTPSVRGGAETRAQACCKIPKSAKSAGAPSTRLNLRSLSKVAAFDAVPLTRSSARVVDASAGSEGSTSATRNNKRELLLPSSAAAPAARCAASPSATNRMTGVSTCPGTDSAVCCLMASATARGAMWASATRSSTDSVCSRTAVPRSSMSLSSARARRGASMRETARRFVATSAHAFRSASRAIRAATTAPRSASRRCT
mmetsp:Transcript_16437/g.66415  ORF Transcript_16437/g.66415 Transcript_16437/m.66415 type:complete len:318 (+) Transcript_16437:572-1525(+)